MCIETRRDFQDLKILETIQVETAILVEKKSRLRDETILDPPLLALLPMLVPALKDLQPRLLLDQDQVALHVLNAKDLAQETAIFVQVFYNFLNLAFLPI